MLVYKSHTVFEGQKTSPHGRACKSIVQRGPTPANGDPPPGACPSPRDDGWIGEAINEINVTKNHT